MDFAGSTILCQFSSSDSATVLRWFCDSLSVQYIRSCNCASLVLRFSVSSVHQILHQSCKCASPILRFCVGSALETALRFRFSANSTILRWLLESCCGFRQFYNSSLVPLADPASFAAIRFSRYRIFISQVVLLQDPSCRL